MLMFTFGQYIASHYLHVIGPRHAAIIFEGDTMQAEGSVSPPARRQ